MRKQPLILGLTAVAAIPALVMGQAYHAMMPAIAGRFGVGSTDYSLLLAASGLGAILGGVVLGSFSALRACGRLLLGAALAWGVLLAAFALSPWYMVSLALLLGVGAANVIFRSLSQTLVQVLSPDQFRGRIMGAYMLTTQGPRMVSGLMSGVLGALLSPPAAMALAGGVVVLAVAAIAARVPSLRQLD